MKVKLAGSDLAYDVSGDGPTLCLLHAFPFHRGMWRPQIEALRGSWRIVTFDARGFGESPRGDGLLTMERIADDAVALLDHLAEDQAVFAGLSMGGYAAFALHRRHRDRVRALVLADTRAEADTDEGRAGRAALSERVRREGAAPAVDAMLPRLLSSHAQSSNPDLFETVRGMLLAAPSGGITDALAGLAARADSTPTLREIRCPALVVVGEEDELTPVGSAETIHQGIAGSRLAIVPRAGHLSNMENPEAFNAAVSSFLTSI